MHFLPIREPFKMNPGVQRLIHTFEGLIVSPRSAIIFFIQRTGAIYSVPLTLWVIRADKYVGLYFEEESTRCRKAPGQTAYGRR